MIALLPAGSESTASSRLRVYALARELARREVPHAIGPHPDATVVVVQKRLTKDILRYVEDARRRGARIVYDVDDVGPALSWWAPEVLVFRMLRMTDAVVTATEEQAAALADAYGARKVHVVENCIDYLPETCLPHANTPPSPLRIIWFGNDSGLSLIERYGQTLRSIPDAELVVCTRPDMEQIFRARLPGIEFVPWSSAGFTATLRSCHVSCLMHDGDRFDRMKSNTRMVTSIAWGVPACVSMTPAYLRAAREGHVEDFAFADAEGLVAAVERLRPRQARLEYLANAQPALWSSHAPAAFARRYVAVLQD